MLEYIRKLNFAWHSTPFVAKELKKINDGDEYHYKYRKGIYTYHVIVSCKLPNYVVKVVRYNDDVTIVNELTFHNL